MRISTCSSAGWNWSVWSNIIVQRQQSTSTENIKLVSPSRHHPIAIAVWLGRMLQQHHIPFGATISNATFILYRRHQCGRGFDSHSIFSLVISTSHFLLSSQNDYSKRVGSAFPLQSRLSPRLGCNSRTRFSRLFLLMPNATSWCSVMCSLHSHLSNRIILLLYQFKSIG